MASVGRGFTTCRVCIGVVVPTPTLPTLSTNTALIGEPSCGWSEFAAAATEEVNACCATLELALVEEWIASGVGKAR